MNISSNLKLILRDTIFEFNRSKSLLYSMSNTTGILSAPINIIIRKYNNRYIIPTMYGSNILPHLESNRNLVVQTTINGSTVLKKTSYSILKTLFDRHRRPTSSLIHIDTGKGYGYYGNIGLILDGNFNPLFVMCVEIEKCINSTYRYLKPVIFISPSVFTREDMMSKYIVKNLIPFYSEIITGFYVFAGEAGEYKYEIRITDDINNIIEKVVSGSPESHDDIMRILSESVNEI